MKDEIDDQKELQIYICDNQMSKIFTHEANLRKSLLGMIKSVPSTQNT